MPFDPSMFDADLAEATDDMPATITWKDNDYRCHSSTLVLGKKLEMEGLYGENSIAFVLRTALFENDRPEESQTVAYKGTTFRILRASTGQDDVSLRLECEEETA